MDLYSTIRDLTFSAHCDFLGVADLSHARAFVDEQGGDIVAGFPRAVSIGLALPHAIVDLLPHRSNPAVGVQYLNHACGITDQRLNEVASRAASLLQRAGYRVMPLTASQGTSGGDARAVFSHKVAAHLAGLGWIGKNCLLVTPQVGPRARWISVLTDAPLAPTGEPMEEQCGGCRECVDICPAQAFTGRPFRKGEPRSARFDVVKCEEYYPNEACGLCLYVCPHGRRA